jgi:hypothetical protein
MLESLSQDLEDSNEEMHKTLDMVTGMSLADH